MMYVYAWKGSQHAINANTIKLFSSLVKVGEQIFEDYRQFALKRSAGSFENFILAGRSFRVYQVAADTDEVAKKHMGKRLLAELKDCDEFKPYFTKALLRS